MGLVEFIVLCLIVSLIAWGGVYLLGVLVPGHPAIIDKLIFGVAVLIIVVTLLRALGLTGYDPQIPKLG